MKKEGGWQSQITTCYECWKQNEKKTGLHDTICGWEMMDGFQVYIEWLLEEGLKIWLAALPLFLSWALFALCLVDGLGFVGMDTYFVCILFVKCWEGLWKCSKTLRGALRVFGGGSRRYPLQAISSWPCMECNHVLDFVVVKILRTLGSLTSTCVWKI